ncbi:MAG: flagellar basal body-associated FliL family protein [Pseudomonadota bacterium]
MSDEQTEEEEAPKKGGKMGLIMGLVMFLAAGGGGFYASYAGLIPGLGGEEKKVEEKAEKKTEKPSFIPIEPLVISLGRGGRNYLRFNAQLEVDPVKLEDVQNAMPRVLDVLNGYLRAVDLEELEDPSALIRLRAQMLRRVQLVTGKGYVRDLLITEFVFT